MRYDKADAAWIRRSRPGMAWVALRLEWYTIQHRRASSTRDCCQCHSDAWCSGHGWSAWCSWALQRFNDAGRLMHSVIDGGGHGNAV